MKINFEREQPKFMPVKVSIKLETLEEAQEFQALLIAGQIVFNKGFVGLPGDFNDKTNGIDNAGCVDKYRELLNGLRKESI